MSSQSARGFTEHIPTALGEIACSSSDSVQSRGFLCESETSEMLENGTSSSNQSPATAPNCTKIVRIFPIILHRSTDHIHFPVNASFLSSQCRQMVHTSLALTSSVDCGSRRKRECNPFPWTNKFYLSDELTRGYHCYLTASNQSKIDYYLIYTINLI